MTLKVEIGGEEVAAVPLDRATVQVLLDHEALPNHGKVELIDGFFVEMTPANAQHAEAVMRIGAAIIAVVGTSKQVLADPAFFLSEDTMLGPDVMVLDRDVDLRTARGSDPDLVIEISHTTLAFDLGLKAERYGRAGVRDYWVLDLEKRLLHVHRAPRSDGFAEVVTVDWATSVTALCLPELTLTLSEVLE